MKKKFAAILLLLAVLCMFAACSKEYDPDPAVKEYLNNGMTAEQAYSRIATATYTETRTLQNKQGVTKGNFFSEVFLDKTDENNLRVKIHSVYEGECVEEDKVTDMTAELSFSEGKYVYTVTKKLLDSDVPVVTKEIMETEDAQNLLVAIIYTDNGAYSEGLYYGDLFMLRIFRFPPESFYVDTEENLCVFDEGMLLKEYYDLEDVELHQVTKINSLGLLMYNYEKYVGTKSDYVLISEITPTYTYLPEKTV